MRGEKDEIFRKNKGGAPVSSACWIVGGHAGNAGGKKTVERGEAASESVSKIQKERPHFFVGRKTGQWRWNTNQVSDLHASKGRGSVAWLQVRSKRSSMKIKKNTKRGATQKEGNWGPTRMNRGPEEGIETRAQHRKNTCWE